MHHTDIMPTVTTHYILIRHGGQTALPASARERSGVQEKTDARRTSFSNFNSSAAEMGSAGDENSHSDVKVTENEVVAVSRHHSPSERKSWSHTQEIIHLHSCSVRL